MREASQPALLPCCLWADCCCKAFARYIIPSLPSTETAAAGSRPCSPACAPDRPITACDFISSFDHPWPTMGMRNLFCLSPSLPPSRPTSTKALPPSSFPLDPNLPTNVGVVTGDVLFYRALMMTAAELFQPWRANIGGEYNR